MRDRLLFLSIVLSFTVALEAAFAQAPRSVSSPSGEITDVEAMMRLENFFEDGSPAVLLLQLTEPSLGLYRYQQGRLQYLRRTEPLAFTNAATSTVEHGKKRILVAYEYGRTFEHAKLPETQKRKKDRIAIVSYDENFNDQRTLYEEYTSRGRVNRFSTTEKGPFIHFSHAEEYSKGGILEPPKLRRLAAGRWQYAVDIFDEMVVTGSPDSDHEERAKELQLFRRSLAEDLPSLRGVSAVRFGQLDSDPEPELLIADGLPNVQHKRTRPEVAVIDFSAPSGKLERVQKYVGSSLQLPITKLEFGKLGPERIVLARGKSQILLLFPEEDWQARIAYRRDTKNEEGPFDFVLLESSRSELTFAVLDGNRVYVQKYQHRRGRP